MSRYPGTTLTPERLYALLPQWGFPLENVLVATVVEWTGADQAHVENLAVALDERGLVDAGLGCGYGDGSQRPTVIEAP
jgi:hypothetical protein